MPIGCPCQRPAPKSACSPFEAPMELMIVAESDSTGSLSTGTFHGLSAGKIAQLVPGSGLAAATDTPTPRATTETATAARRTSLSSAAGSGFLHPRKSGGPLGAPVLDRVAEPPRDLEQPREVEVDRGAGLLRHLVLDR